MLYETGGIFETLGTDTGDGTPVLDQLAELDRTMSAKNGKDWVYSIPPDHDGPLLLADGDDFVLGPKARAVILEIRKINDLITASA